MDSPIDTADPVAPAPAEPPADVAALLTGAAERAREAITEFSGETAGDYLGVAIEDEAAT